MLREGVPARLDYLYAGGVNRPSRWKFYLYTDSPIYRPGQVTLEQPRYVGAGKGAFLVKATYYFGAPVAQAKVRYVLREQPYSAWRLEPGDEETAPLYPNLYPADIYGYSPASETYTQMSGRGWCMHWLYMATCLRGDRQVLAPAQQVE